MKQLLNFLLILLSFSGVAFGQKQKIEQDGTIIVCKQPNYTQADIDQAINVFIEKELDINLNDVESIFAHRNQHFLPLKHVPLALVSVFVDSPSCVVNRHLKSYVSVTINTGDNLNDCAQKSFELEVEMTDGSTGTGNFDQDIKIIEKPKCL